MTMLTAEFVPQWLPSGIIAGDGELRRLEIIHGGVFWEGESTGETPDDEAIKWCMPWTWKKQITLWRCWWVSPDGLATRRTDLDAEVIPQAALQDQDQVAEALREVYAAQIMREVKARGVPRTVCLPRDLREGCLEFGEESLPQREFSGWVRGFIAQKAQTLAPYNLVLQLAWLTKAVTKPTLPALDKAQDSESGFVWFPAFEPESPWDDKDPQVTWNPDERLAYAVFEPRENGPSLKVYARVARDAPENGQMSIMRYHAENGLEPLRLGSNMSVTDTQEWLSGLSHRAAVALDLPRWLVSWLQTVGQVNGPNPDNLVAFLTACQRYLLCASRDVRGFGHVRGPDGRSLAQAVWRHAVEDGWWFVAGGFRNDPTDPQKLASLPAFEAALKDADAAYDERRWTKVIEEVAGKPPPALLHWNSPEQVDSSVLESFVFQAAAFLDFIDQPEQARQLIRRQYEELGWRGMSLSWVEQALAGLADPALDQAEGLLASYWEEVLRAARGGPSASESARRTEIARALLHAIAASEEDAGRAWATRFGASELFPNGLTDPFVNARKPTASNRPSEWGKFVKHVHTGFGIDPSPADTKALVSAMFTQRTKTVMELLFPSENDVYSAPPPVCVAVDQPAASDEQASQENAIDDLNDVIAGVLLFCREDGKPWRALNAATIDIDPDDSSLANVCKNLLIASPVGEQDGVRGAYRRFDNQSPSIVVSPGEHQAPTDGAERAREEGNEEPQWLRLRLARGHKAPCLHYGRSYLIAGALMTNAGVLPPSLRKHPDEPEYLAIPTLDAWERLESTRPEVRLDYRRRVPVGSVRLTSSTPLSSLPLPQGPNAGRSVIRPLACELPAWTMPDSNEESPPGRTLVVVFPGKHSKGVKGGHFDTMSFEVVKPSTGFWNWFAWQDDWERVTAGTRIAERSAEINRGDGETVPPSSLDDPAVADVLRYDFEQVFPPASSVSGCVEYSPAPRPAGDRHPRSGSIKVTVKVGGTRASCVPRDGALLISLPEGTVARLTLRSLVAKQAFDARFHACMKHVPGTIQGVKHENTEHYAVTPVEVWIEAAADWTQAATHKDERRRRSEQLWSALRLDGPSNEDNRRLTGRMVYSSEGWMSQVGRLQVLHQVWRWDGREVDRSLLDKMLGEPAADRDARDSESQAWDGAAFATRPDHACRSSEASLTADTRLPEQQVFVEDLRDDPRCTYHRVAVRAFSRYEAVYGEDILGMSEPVEEDIATPWRRVVVKAGRTDQLRKPAVRFALPLTRDLARSETEEEVAASVMLVLDDVWFAEVGLGEGLEVGIRVLTDPEGKGHFANAGFDPTLTAASLGPCKDGDMISLAGSLLGPYGLTRDFAAKMPKLCGSVFILRVPVDALRANGVAIESDLEGRSRLPWFMCEVATRRVLRSAAVARGKFAVNQASEPVEQASEWSARTWVQFVPNTEMLLPRAWRERGPDSSSPSLSVQSTQGLTSFEVADLPLFDDTFEQRHERWIVLSERIVDIKGHPAEKYRATFVRQRSADGAWRFVRADGDVELTSKDARSGYVRLLLVRHRAGYKGEANPWDRLFPDSKSPEGADDSVRNDATHGAPIVTGRVAVRF